MPKSLPIFIAGGGPSGCATALKLDRLGIPSILAEKKSFPRDKVCGDALSGKVIVNLKRIDPKLLDEFYDATWKHPAWGIRFIAPNGKHLDVPFETNPTEKHPKAPGFVAKRMDFDNFLAEKTKQSPNVTFLENTTIETVEALEHGYQITATNGQVWQTPLFIDAMGAHSPFTRKNLKHTIEDKHYSAAVRAYYEGVTGFHEPDFIELQFIDPLLPGYLWVFALPDGQANVGLGIRTDHLKKKKLNLTKTLETLLQTHPQLKDRFKNATRTSKVMGYGLPIGSKSRPLSGDHYMLTGDAGYLIDPLTGEGIGNAMYSGVFAAEQASECLAANDFSAKRLKAYDERIHRVIGKEMKLSSRLQKVLSNKRMANLLANLITNNTALTDVISKMYADIDLRAKIIHPSFWLKLILFRKIPK